MDWLKWLHAQADVNIKLVRTEYTAASRPLSHCKRCVAAK